MKTWLTKFRISCSKDSNRPRSSSLCRAVTKSEELRAFAEEMDAIESDLKEPRPAVQLPPWLHARIMRGVREEAVPAAPQYRAHWAWIPAAALVLLFCVWQWTERASAPAAPGWSTSVTTTIETGQRMAVTMPNTVVSPLTDEWQYLNHDLLHARDFLLASLP